jgi:hypothetical protein
MKCFSADEVGSEAIFTSGSGLFEGGPILVHACSEFKIGERVSLGIFLSSKGR